MRIVISKRGYGYGRDAIELLLNFAFNKLNTHRFWLDVRLHNEKAIGVYRKMGFIEEGILREAVKLNSGYVSIMIMSILRQDYLKDFGQEMHP
jgi:RimJ/RimL family protein N-acetyltransferase